MRSITRAIIVALSVSTACVPNTVWGGSVEDHSYLPPSYRSAQQDGSQPQEPQQQTGQPNPSKGQPRAQSPRQRNNTYRENRNPRGLDWPA